MNVKEVARVFLLMLIWGFIGFFLGGILGMILIGFLFTFFSHILICRIIYGKTYGAYKIGPFACHIFDSKGNVIASFKGDDWVVVEKPISLIHKQTLEIQKNLKTNPRASEETKKITIDYTKKLWEFLNIFTKRQIPDAEPIEQVSKDKKNNNPSQLTKIDLKIEDALRKTGFDEKLLLSFRSLDNEKKKLFVKIARRILASMIISSEPLKVYKIASLSNGVFMYWIGHSEPPSYFTYKHKQYFRKWRSFLPWQKGMPVVEMWGSELRDVYDIEGVELRGLFCMPIQDERYRELKGLLIQSYEIIASALTSLTEDILPALPYISRIGLILTEREMFKQEKEIFKEGMISVHQELSEMYSMLNTAIKLATKVVGAEGVVVSPQTRKAIADLGVTMKEIEKKKGKIERIMDTVKGLTKEETTTKPATLPTFTTEQEKTETSEQ